MWLTILKLLGAIAAIVGGYWLWDVLKGGPARREGRRIRKKGRNRQ